MVKILITLSIVAIISISSFGFAGEMERWTFNTNTDQTLKLMDNNFRWQDNQVKYYQKEMERTFINSVPDPSNIYVMRKLEHDVLKGLNTAISVGSALGGNPISVASAINTVTRNYGPQEGPIQNATGRVGDVINVVNVFRSANDIVNRNYSEAGIRLSNIGLGMAITQQKRQLKEPITVSDSKQIRFRSDDGFTRVESLGSVSATKTYDPPPLRPVGGPDIFDRPTKTVTHSQWKSTVTTGNFNNNSYRNNNINFKTPTFITPNFNHNINVPRINFNLGRIR